MMLVPITVVGISFMMLVPITKRRLLVQMMMVLETKRMIKLVKSLHQLSLYTIISLSWSSRLGQNGRNKIPKNFMRYSSQNSFLQYVIIISLNTVILVILSFLDLGMETKISHF